MWNETNILGVVVTNLGQIFYTGYGTVLRLWTEKKPSLLWYKCKILQNCHMFRTVLTTFTIFQIIQDGISLLGKLYCTYRWSMANWCIMPISHTCYIIQSLWVIQFHPPLKLDKSAPNQKALSVFDQSTRTLGREVSLVDLLNSTKFTTSFT